jgi:hypothetical protein
MFVALDAFERLLQILDTPAGHLLLLTLAWVLVPYFGCTAADAEKTRAELFGAFLYALKGQARANG